MFGITFHGVMHLVVIALAVIGAVTVVGGIAIFVAAIRHGSLLE